MLTRAPRHQERMSDPFEMEVLVVMSYLTWVMGTKLQQVLLTAEPSQQPVQRDVLKMLLFTFQCTCILVDACIRSRSVEARDHLRKLVFSFHCLDPRALIQTSGLGDRYPYPLTDLIYAHKRAVHLL